MDALLRPRLPLERLCLVLAAAILAPLFLPSALPFSGGFSQPWDKVAHLAVYSALTALLWIGTAGRARALVAAAVVAIGALDEGLQALVPGRSPDFFDFAVDVAAVAATTRLMGLYEARHRPRCSA